MLFTRLYDKKLAQASYMIGCQVTGEAIIVDPNRDVAQYVAAAAAERMRIVAVTETHIHADFVSGARELAERTRAQLLLSAEGGPEWQYAFATASNARLLHDGDVINVGNLRLDVMHTPGHTPEHLSFLLTDAPASPHPVIIMTGDFVFVGDVGRPDLLEKAAHQANTMEDSARTLWRSLDRFRALPDHVQVWPGHGAGSACGKALGAVPSSTVGYEKLANWGLTAPNEAAFVQMVLDGQPEPPAYFARMKRVNKEGPVLMGKTAAPVHLDAVAFADLQSNGAVVVDTRPADAFARQHLQGAINIPLNRSFPTYAGSVVPFDVPLLILTSDDAGTRAAEAIQDLTLIGFDRIAGFAGPSLLTGVPTETLARVSPADAIAQHASGTPIIDVRNASEWAQWHVPDARRIPFPELASRIAEIPHGEPVLVQCESGARSAIAASLLKRLGINAIDAGGIVAWQRAGGHVT